MTRTEWIRNEDEIESKIEDLEDRYKYIQKVWLTLYKNNVKQLESVETMAATFKKLQSTDTEKYLYALEDFVEFMEKATIYVKPTQTTAKE